MQIKNLIREFLRESHSGYVFIKKVELLLELTMRKGNQTILTVLNELLIYASYLGCIHGFIFLISNPSKLVQNIFK